MNTTHNTNKTVIVTGASSGIGYALVEAYLTRGYNVVGNARTAERLQAAAEKLGNPKNFLQVPGDIAKQDTAKELFKQAIAAFGQVDILINNAGIFIAKPIAHYTENDLDSLVNTNLKGFFYPSQEAAAHMAANKQGHIVTITASIAMAPNVKLPALLPILIKGGLNHATRGLALELAASNVKVNAVAPGSIDTPLHRSDDATTKFRKALAPMDQTGLTDDIVDAVMYITDSQFTTGTILTVDGGATAGVW